MCVMSESSGFRERSDETPISFRSAVCVTQSFEFFNEPSQNFAFDTYITYPINNVRVPILVIVSIFLRIEKKSRAAIFSLKTCELQAEDSRLGDCEMIQLRRTQGLCCSPCAYLVKADYAIVRMNVRI